MEAFYTEFQNWIMRGCLCALAVLVPLWLLMLYVPYCIRRVKDFWSCHIAPRGFVFKVCVALFFGINFYLGATKPSYSRVTYDGGIKAGATANSITNDTVSITWQRDLSGGVYVPESAAVYIDYREIGETNGVWALLAETTVGAWSWSGTVQNATNYNYNVWAYYIPPEPVHTNGVWTYKTMRDRAEKYVLPLRATVTINNRVISPPNRYEPPPYDAEVEYLESTGTQYIDTGVYLSNNHSIEIDYQFTSANQRRTGLFGGLVNTGNSQGRYGGLLSPSNGYLEMGYGEGNVYYQIGVADLNRHTIVQDMSELYLDGSLIYTFPSSTFSMGATALLFNFRYTNYTPARCKIYRAKVWLNGVLIRDYIPVRKNGVGYLYDRVSGQLFGNAGTGAFGVGPDK